MAERSVCGSLFWHHNVLPSDASDPEGRIFSSAPDNYDRFFFLHTFWTPAFDFNIGVAINEFICVDVRHIERWRRVWRQLSTELRDLQYNQCIDKTCCYSVFIYPRYIR